jgi:hypothetical protein
MPLWRFVWDDGKSLFYRDWNLPNASSIEVRTKFHELFKRQTWEHGIGRHSQAQTLDMLKGDLKTVSKILGTKKFILGDEPCVEDCSIFGFVAQALYGMPESPYEKLVQGKPKEFKLC